MHIINQLHTIWPVFFAAYDKGAFIIYGRGGGEPEGGAKISRPIVVGGGGGAIFF